MLDKSQKALYEDALRDAGIGIIDEDTVQEIREMREEGRVPMRNVLFTQKGGQTDMLASPADISIVGGGRGGGKSYVLLMNPLYDIHKANFRAIIFRKELDDLSDLVNTSAEIYQEFGTYNRAKNDMTWNFTEGGWLTFSYHDMEEGDFHDRYQGKQYAYIGVDEITQLPYKKFKVLSMSNRNAYHIRNRIVGTCNPDPDSWVARFIEWWIDQETGLPIPERASKVRYCFMDGDDPTQIIWGSTREEVFDKCRDTLLAYWSPEYARYGTPQELFIKSVTFTPAKLADNIALMSSDPTYLASLLAQDEETRERFLNGNWKYKAAGDDLIKIEHIERFYGNAIQKGDGIRRVSCDAAFDGGDQCVFWLRIGNHFADIATCQKDSKGTIEFTRALLNRWGVREENFSYDLMGIGQVFKGFFPKAVPFNAKEAVDKEYKGVYYNMKAQAFQYFADHIKDGTYSIAPEILNRRFSGKNYKNKPLREILNEERKCIRFREDDPTRVIDKTREMKRIIHRSPDFIEGATITEIFNIKHQRKQPRNIGLVAGIPYAANRQRVNRMYHGWW